MTSSTTFILSPLNKVPLFYRRPLKLKNNNKQVRQIDAKYTRLTPSCNHPRNFIATASIVLEICTGQNSSMKINKGNNSKIKQTRVKVHVHCTPP